MPTIANHVNINPLSTNSNRAIYRLTSRTVQLPLLNYESPTAEPTPCVAELEDPCRETKNKPHTLGDILIIVFCSVPSGIEDWVGMENFALEKASPGAGRPVRRRTWPRPGACRSTSSAITTPTPPKAFAVASAWLRSTTITGPADPQGAGT